ncbi:MAG: ACT domain-containing protein [Deltaproteobacteria bacterium]|nr:ACT domain-containing protein [Deltaproteobacteria bacterium]
MLTLPPDAGSDTPSATCPTVVLRLLVRNHPGVLSHVSGLFARRAFNVDGILCVPVGDGARSAILLLVRADGRLEQLALQLAKLEDVLDVAPAPAGGAAFAAVAGWLEEADRRRL